MVVDQGAEMQFLLHQMVADALMTMHHFGNSLVSLGPDHNLEKGLGGSEGKDNPDGLW